MNHSTIRRDIDDVANDSKGSSARSSIKTPATTSTSLQPPTDIHLRGLVDGLTRFFTPTNKRPSRVSQNAVQRSANLVQSSPSPALARLRKPPISPSFVKVKKIFPKAVKSVANISISPPASAGGLAARKPRREQLIDGLSHFFSAQGKRKTRFNKCAYGESTNGARSRSSSGRNNEVLDETPRLRALSANASTSTASSLVPLGNSMRWSSENLGCKGSSPNLQLSPLMVSRLKSTKWLSNTRKQPESLMLKLNACSSVGSSTFSSSGELSAAMSPDSFNSARNSLCVAASELRKFFFLLEDVTKGRNVMDL